MSRSLRAYVRLVLFGWAGIILMSGLTVPAGASAPVAPFTGGVLGLVAACVPWRRVWLRLQVAWLRSLGGRGLVYLKADYGGRERMAEAPAAGRPEKRLVQQEAGCDCSNCLRERGPDNDQHGLEVYRIWQPEEMKRRGA